MLSLKFINTCPLGITIHLTLALFLLFFSQAVMADNGRLQFLERIGKRFIDLIMAHKGQVKVLVTTVIVSFELSITWYKEIYKDHI